VKRPVAPLHAALLVALLAAPPAHAEAPPPIPEGKVDIVEQLGAEVPRDLPFVDSAGRSVRLGDTFTGRPIVLALVYHRCLGLCSLLLGGLTKSLNAVDWQLGRELDVVTVSIDPEETPALAASSRAGYLQALGRPPSDTAWAALTGPASSIDALAASVGFRFQYLDGQKQFAHAAALFVLTPDGRVSRYLYGVEFPPRQLKAALFEASGGRVGTSFERVILRCWQWDPTSRRYAVFLDRYFRVGGLVLLAVIGAFLAVLWRRDLQRSRA
jgi:protein SCO1/2